MGLYNQIGIVVVLVINLYGLAMAILGRYDFSQPYAYFNGITLLIAILACIAPLHRQINYYMSKRKRA